MLPPIRRAATLLALAAATSACADRTPTHPTTAGPAASVAGARVAVAPLDAATGGVQAVMARANLRLAAAGAPVRVARAELSLAGNPSAQTVVFAKDRELRLDSRWVPFDPRRGGTAVLRHANFLPLMYANGTTPGAAAVNAAYGTWNGVTCNGLATNLVTLPTNVFPSLILSINGFVQDPFQADINIIGWLPASLFNAFFGADGPYILGVTWTFIWVDGTTDIPTDIDHDGRLDTALKEMWFNDYSPWSNTGVGGYDIQTIALHEEGHTLELGHFGKVFLSGSGKLQESPRAVMNAFYLGVLRAPLGSDVAALCGNFGSWPN